MIISLILLLLKAANIYAQYRCPTGCDCLPDPILPTSALISCHWTSFPDSFKFSNSSQIRSIQIFCDAPFQLPETTFKGLSSLQQLKLENCRTKELAPKIFEDLTNLRNLELTKLNPIDGSFTLSDEVLSPLARLEQLHVTNSKLPYLPQKIYCALPNLQVVNMSGNSLLSMAADKQCMGSQIIIADFSRNSIGQLGDDTHTLPAVRHLNLAHNTLTTISEGELGVNRLIQELNLEDNIITQANDLPDTIVDLNLASNHFDSIPDAIIRLRHLTSLNLSSNLLGDINSTMGLNSTSLEKLDLSHNKLTKVATSFYERSLQSLTFLRLDFNLISKIDEAAFQNYSKLQTLNLGSNRIEVVKNGAFSGLQQLALLNLGNNTLHTIEPSVFDGISIDTLDLSHNGFTEAPMAIGQLFKLKKINLSWNKISKLYQFVFKQIPHLHSIDLSHNELQSVGPYIFSDCASLTHLDLSSNRISLLFKDAFSKCPQLKRLNLSDNRISSYEDSLSQASSVKKLDLSSNKLELLQWSALPAKLEYLTADNNHITLLAAAENSNVRFVSLRENLITQIVSDQIPNSIETLDVAHNKINHIGKMTFSSKSALKTLNLTDNALKSVHIDSLKVIEGVHPVEVHLLLNPLTCSCDMDWIKDREVTRRKVILLEQEKTQCIHPVDGRILKINEVEKADFLCDYSQICEPDCICCQYANCDCKATCPNSCRCFRDSTYKTNIVNCEGNSSSISKPISLTDLPQSATHIFISKLPLTILKSNSFVNRRKLQQLRLNSTGLTTIQPKAFHLLPSLKLLDLSENKLTTLTGDEFQKTPQISHLFLNGNLMQTIEKSLLEKLPTLKFVTLHQNLIPYPPEHLSQLESISLAGNPLRCDCVQRGPAPLYSVRSAPFWFAKNRNRVVDAERVECMENITRSFHDNDTTILSAYPPNIGHDIFTMPMDEFLRDFNVSICVPHSTGFFGADPQNSILYIVLGGSALLLIVTLILLGVALIRKTHDAMNQRRYKTSSLNCSSTPGSSPLPLPLISYHAFVSYSKKDEKLITDQLVRPLEEDDYQLCLLHRDGPIYNSNIHSISDELIDQMHASQCLILVLTKNFLENEWKTLQIKTSHQLFAKNRTKRLIAILGENVQPNALDDELGGILRKNTCIRIKDHLFWSLLRSSLPPRLTPPPSDASQIYSDIYGIVPSAIV
ncbi:hypothetical protein WR25_10513 [Diploscapter pachys]|uniref:TIR domain-containing protein n=1 Tax=Diploscapter pachys TaxID=2018661 RepID=A0A2A2JZ17_9BILA|nr:hypothetical protein WR25_10513 [Diploscapter pachys]